MTVLEGPPNADLQCHWLNQKVFFRKLELQKETFAKFSLEIMQLTPKNIWKLYF